MLLLPHGSEGQGPEHSSARLERFLQLSALRQPTRGGAQHRGAVLTTSCGRRPMPPGGVPLIVMTPKSLLRAEAAKSRAEEFTGIFQPVLPDPTPPQQATRLLLCTGKVAYDLLDHRRKQADSRSAIARIERAYPFPADELATVLRAFPDVRELRWVQEEPANMGAWTFLAPRLRNLAPDLPLGYVGRPENPSPATGSARIFQIEQERVVAEALTETLAGTPATDNR